tara:strand:+ start:422 stop:625 length:204 start_codon:yes stop_codon:yes gene_type:complete
MAFKILKQLIPAPTGSDPHWAQRNVWVEKLTSDDTRYEYSLENAAITKRDELTAADTTGRLYRVIES